MQGPLSRDGVLKLVVAGATVLALLVEGYSRYCGFLFTSDSFQYLSAAHSFRASGVFLSPDGSHYAHWPPLYPVLLNLFADPIWSANVIHLLCKLVLSWLVYRLSMVYLTDNRTRAIFALSVLLGVHLLLISVFIWSELVFVTLALAMLYHHTQKPDRLLTGWLLALGFLLCLQRNAGVFWIAGLATGWLLARGLSLPRATQAAAFFLICTSGMWAWNSYNTWFVPAAFAFYQHPFFSAVPGNFMRAGTQLAAAFFPAPPHALWGVLLAVLHLVALGVLWKFRTHALALPVWLAIVFCAGFVVLGPLDHYELDRYLCIVPLLLYLPLLRGFEMACTRYALPPRVVWLVLIVLTSYPLVRTAQNAHRWHQRSCLPAVGAAMPAPTACPSPERVLSSPTACVPPV